MAIVFNPGQRVKLTARNLGGVRDVEWLWVPPEGSSAPESNSNVLEWDASAGDEGIYKVKATNADAPDSPTYGTFRLDPPPVSDPDAQIVIQNVVNNGGSIRSSVREAYNNHVIRLKAGGLWDGGTGERFWYFAGAEAGSASAIDAQCCWVRGNPDRDRVVLTNFTSEDHDPAKGLQGNGSGKFGLAGSIDDVSLYRFAHCWIACVTQLDTNWANIVSINRPHLGAPTRWDRTFLHMRPSEAFVALDTEWAGAEVNNIRPDPNFNGLGITVNPQPSSWIPFAVNGDQFNVDAGWLNNRAGQSAFPPTILGISRTAPADLGTSDARIFMLWIRPNTMPVFTTHQIVDFIAEARRYHDELQVALGA